LGQLTFLVSIGITFVTGAFGNEIYRRHCERLVASAAGNSAQADDRLKRRGGTSTLALFVTIGATVLFIAWSVAGQMKQMQEAPAGRAVAG
jgi:ferric-dicitrate binding protein FerR (iron transport regulator)